MLFASACLLALLASGAAAGEPTRLPCSADTWIEAPPWERAAGRSPAAENHGRDLELVLNGRNDFALLQFDFSAVKGKSVRKARLRVYRKPAAVPLAMVGLSTISGSGPWSETDVTYLGNGARPWAYPGSDITDVTFSLGGSLYDYVKPRDAGDGWWEIDVPAPLVTALATGGPGARSCASAGPMPLATSCATPVSRSRQRPSPRPPRSRAG